MFIATAIVATASKAGQQESLPPRSQFSRDDRLLRENVNSYRAFQLGVLDFVDGAVALLAQSRSSW